MYQEDYGKEPAMIFNVFVDIMIIAFFYLVMGFTIHYGRKVLDHYVFVCLFLYAYWAVTLIKNIVESYSKSLSWKELTSYCFLWFGFFMSVYAGWFL